MIAACLLLALPTADGLPPGALDRLGSPTLRHSSRVAAVAFSPDGKRLASGSNVNEGGTDPAVKVWDVATGALVVSVRHDSTSVAWFADGTRIASAGRDGTVKAWDVATGKEVFTATGDGGWAVGVAVSPDGKALASIHGNRVAVRVWDVATGKLVRELVPADAGPKQYTQGVVAVAFHPGGKSVAAAVLNVGLVFWDTATGTEGRTIPVRYGSGRGESIVFDARGTVVAAPKPTGLGLYDPATGAESRAVRGSDTESGYVSAHPLALSADGGTLVLVHNGDPKLWDVKAGRGLRAIDRSRFTGGAAFSPDGTRLAYAAGYGVVLEDAATGRRLHARPHDNPVWRVGFGPAGEAYTHDGNLRVWDIGSGGKRRGELVKVAEGVVALSPDFRTAVHGGYIY